MSLPAATAETLVPAAETGPVAAVALPTVETLMDEAPVEVELPSRYRLPQAAAPPDIKVQAAVARLVA